MASLKHPLSGFCFRYFHWMSGFILRLLNLVGGYAKLEATLEAADIKIYSAAYVSILGFLALLSPLTLLLLLLLGHLLFLPWLLLPVFSPFLVVLLGYAVPRIMASNRASNLEMEVPFASAYISVMATGGLSPYASLQRLKACSLLPNISKAAKNIELDVRTRGLDPVAAMEKSAEHLPSSEYREMMLGYASTLRSGGDVVHYLHTRTETMFLNLSVKMKEFAHRAGMFMEVFISVSVLVALSLYAVHMTSMAFERFFQGMFSTSSFLLFAYVLLPVISLTFIYLADASQPRNPINEWLPCKVFLATSPLTILLALTMFLPFVAPAIPTLPFAGPFMSLVTAVCSLLGLEQGHAAAMGLGLTLIIGTLPAAITSYILSRKSKGLEEEMTNFLRDLTEARKTGLSPEKCIENISGRKYGKLTKHLKVVSRQIRWGLPFKVVYETFKRRVKSWLTLINVYLMVDAIDVGGGSPETLETLTHYSEILSSIEKEKKGELRPLMFLPYVGAGILLISVVMFLGFVRSVMMSLGSMAIPFSQFLILLLPPLILHAYITGIVTGKISSGSVSAGIKHAIFLTVTAILVMCLSGYFQIPFSIGG